MFARSNATHRDGSVEFEEDPKEKANRLKNQLSGFSGQEIKVDNRPAIVIFCEYVYKVVDGTQANRWKKTL